MKFGIGENAIDLALELSLDNQELLGLRVMLPRCSSHVDRLDPEFEAQIFADDTSKWHGRVFRCNDEKTLKAEISGLQANGFPVTSAARMKVLERFEQMIVKRGILP